MLQTLTYLLPSLFAYVSLPPTQQCETVGPGNSVGQLLLLLTEPP